MYSFTFFTLTFFYMYICIFAYFHIFIFSYVFFYIFCIFYLNFSIICVSDFVLRYMWLNVCMWLFVNVCNFTCKYSKYKYKYKSKYKYKFSNVTLCYNINIGFYNLFLLVQGEVHDEANICDPNLTRSTKLRGTQSSPEVSYRSTDFHAPENLTFQPSKLQSK